MICPYGLRKKGINNNKFYLISSREINFKEFKKYKCKIEMLCFFKVMCENNCFLGHEAISHLQKPN